MDDDYKEKQQEDAEEQMVEEAYQKLVKAYLETKHRKKTDIIQKAFNFAKFAHRGVRRLSGEPYIMHPITVAQIVCSEIGLGSTSICAALLHDVVEDTDYTVEDIENMFGPKIAQIVDGLTKIAGGIFGENASAQAENFKKLLLTMNDDIRVILIKIADRLHNMRTLGSQPKNKQYKIAGETLYIYAPLAHRLGLNRIKNELENLSFHYEHPQEYDAIVAKLKDTEEHRNTVFDEFTKPISAELNRMGIQHEIKARIKTPYSIWKKMKTKNVEFEEVFDILAVRIIFEPKDEKNVLQECFNIYVTMCNFYRSHPDRLRDWVTHPKANVRLMDIRRSTSLSCRNRVSGLKCRSGPGKWMRLLRKVWRRTGNTRTVTKTYRKGRRKRNLRNGLPQSRSCSTTHNPMPWTSSTLSSLTFSLRRFLSSPLREN